jgi:ankyrin repeat protein
MLQRALRNNTININCVDSLGRGALTLAIDGENLEMVELLIIMGVETKDALLEAINQEFVEAVELLLEHEELIHKENEPYVRAVKTQNIVLRLELIFIFQFGVTVMAESRHQHSSVFARNYTINPCGSQE